MSLEEDLFSALRTLVGNRVSPVVFPQPPVKPTWPAILYSIDTTPVVDICGDGDDSTADARVQLDVVASTYAAARALRLQVMAAMQVFVTPAILQFSTGDFDEETRTFREVLQYTVHGSSDVESP